MTKQKDLMVFVSDDLGSKFNMKLAHGRIILTQDGSGETLSICVANVQFMVDFSEVKKLMEGS